MAYNQINYGGSRSVAPRSYYNKMDQVDLRSYKAGNAGDVPEVGAATTFDEGIRLSYWGRRNS